MDCSELEKLLDGRSVLDLSDEDRDAVAEHVRACEPCWVKWGLDDDSQSLHQLGEAFPPFSTLKDDIMMRLSTGAAGVTKPLPVESDEDRPSRIGGFEVLAPLGKGGMGTVYRARQVSMERIVALKLLPKRLETDDAYVARFFREARSAATLRHQNIVQAYDVGREDGRYFFAMEYVEGEDLRFVLRREGPLDQERAVRYLKQTCAALAAAHARGIIHRDIKPSNLIVDSEDTIRVADFGLAKRTDGDTALTADGQTLGTPAYVSPELASGKKVDGRSDLYSLGATFFRLLAGRPLFFGTSFAGIVVKHVNETPPLLEEVAPHVDRRLCCIIDRLLAKDPDDRFDSATALLAELDALGELGTGEGPDPMFGDTETTLIDPPPEKKRRTPPHLMVVWLIAGLAGFYLAFYGLTCRYVMPPKPAKEPIWQPLFDGVTLNGWQRVPRIDMDPADAGTGESGAIYVEGEAIVLEAGDPFTLLRWTGEFPRTNYEVRMEAMRREGDQDFCNLFFPVGSERCSLQLGGWLEDMVGLDEIDGQDPRDNGTGKPLDFPNDEWTPVRLRVTDSAIRVWVREEQVIDFPVPGHTFTYHEKYDVLGTFGIVTAWVTEGAVRHIELRKLQAADHATIVTARDTWQDSGEDVVEGVRYTLSATGRWGRDGQTHFGPDGESDPAAEDLPLPDALPYVLLGKIGPDGPPFVVGSGVTFEAHRGGRLLFQMNDGRLSDNTGSVRVTVEEEGR